MSRQEDLDARKLALNPRESFIIQAPAGSGKTELLTQRFLSLLSTVSAPEQIIAITFTKKAASEMQTRLLQRLKLGEQSTPPKEVHLKDTWLLAKEALKRDKEKDWQILMQPARLQIKTIDSLCQFLCQQMPLIAGDSAMLPVSEHIFDDYIKASAECLDNLLKLDAFKVPTKTLLYHLGNQQERLVMLFANLLACREQWLPIILKAGNYDKKDLDKALNFFKKDVLSAIKKSLSPQINLYLKELIPYLCENLDEDAPLKIFLTLDEINTTTLTFNHWQVLAKTLLTSQQKIKAKLTKKEGLISPSSCKGKEAKDKALYFKSLSDNLLQLVGENKDLLAHFKHALQVPTKAIEKNHFHLIECINQILPALAASLLLYFKKNQRIDFNALSINALTALGDGDAPSDLALYLDNKIHHLLIDEFQDTSHQQFHLIERLTYQWELENDRTLFLVGDPMQSIYRFRQAEVAFFLKAKDEGIGGLTLNFLKLSQNFRTHQAMIDYTNDTFSKLFPKIDNPMLGAVSYHFSSATKTLEIDETVTTYIATDKNEETQKVISIIKANPNKSIAILTRTRNELPPIIKALKQENIAFQGVDIENLATKSITLDLLALAKLINQPTDDLALCSLLHSPFCGLSYQSIETLIDTMDDFDLLSLMNLKNPPLTDNDELENLNFFIHTIKRTKIFLKASSFDEKLYLLFLALGGYSLFSDNEKPLINDFFSLLKKHISPTQIKDVHLFENALKTLYAKDNRQANVQLMTIHKSKGLEFDVVILPSLEKAQTKSEPPLLRFTTFSDEYEEHLLIAPIKSIYQTESELYQFLNYLDKQKAQHELKRLLYVAVTRTKKQLFLLATNEPDKAYPKDSFLAMLNPKKQEQTPETLNEVQEEVLPECYLNYQQVKRDTFSNLVNFRDSLKEKAPSTFIIDEENKDKIGTFLHALIHTHSQFPFNKDKNTQHQRILNLLNEYPTLNKNTEIINLAFTTIESLLTCPIAKWLFQDTKDAENEYPLCYQQKLFIMDRTFIKNEKRWIVDYKFGEVQPESYFKQLKNYAKLFSILTPKTDIYCLLYYPLSRDVFSYQYQSGKLLPIPVRLQNAHFYDT